jgi:hypothetical protein
MVAVDRRHLQEKVTFKQDQKNDQELPRVKKKGKSVSSKDNSTVDLDLCFKPNSSYNSLARTIHLYH